MSLNKFTDNIIKPYLSIGCNKVNSNEIKIDGNPIISGYYTPTISVSAGGNFTNTICRYTIISNIMTLSLYSLYETGLASNAFYFDISIPSGYELDNSISPNVFSATGNITPSTSGVPMLTVNCYPAGNNVVLLMKNYSTDFPAGSFCNINCNMTCSIKNL